MTRKLANLLVDSAAEVWNLYGPTETTVFSTGEQIERGEDDTNFEKQSALFALAVADVLLINLWCHDIGREHGSGKPLLPHIDMYRSALEQFLLPDDLEKLADKRLEFLMARFPR